MALSDTSTAIGAAAQLLSYQISLRTGAHVTVGPVEETTSTSGARLNLFLFETAVDASMRSVALDAGQAPPLWLVLRFLLTAFDSGGKSDTVAAHRVLGAGLGALQALAYLPLEGVSADDFAALRPNPEPLKISTLETNSELLSGLFGGSEDRYRLSVAFELRPVMIAPLAPAAYGLLVGIDYEADAVIGEQAVAITLGPGLQPTIEQIVPSSAALGEQVRIYGEGITAELLADLEGVELPLTITTEGTILFGLDSLQLTGNRISAGSRSLRVIRQLPSGRRRSSRPVVFDLQPTVDGVAVSDVTALVASDPSSPLTATLTIDGALLGNADDDVFVGLYRDGVARGSFDDLSDLPGPAQTRRRLVIPEVKALAAGSYRLILRVNGVQARQSPEIVLGLP
ncbi:MAG TPA: DUF4255 domain-containing protein [Nannocystis exedens]|nr:DUF4255 domain-containing protein [Nannocystis exedens]